MLHGQMLIVQMSPRQLTTHTDGLTIQPSKFGWVLTSNSGDMASYLLRNSIIFKLGQMLYRQMLTVQMSPGQLTTHTDGLTIQPSNFGWGLTNNSGDMASHLLQYSIIFKLGQMLHGQMFPGQTSPRQLTIHADGLTIQPSKFCWVLTSNSGDMASYLLLNYRDPKIR